MRKILLLLSIFLLLILTGCQFTSFTIENEFEENYYPGMVIDLENNTGDINIENWEKEKVKIIAIITGRADTINRAEKIAQRTEINTRLDNNILKIRQSLPDRIQGYTNSLSVSYIIKIPEDFSANLITNTGDINIENVSGNLNIKGNTGDINTTGVIKGNIDIEINTGSLNLFEVYGDLNVDGNTGDVLIDFLMGQIHVEINTGNIKGNLFLENDMSNRIKTNTGNINVNLDHGDSLKLISQNRTGDFSISNMEFDQTQISKNKFEGYIGDGSTKLEIRSTTGDIIIRGN